MNNVGCVFNVFILNSGTSFSPNEILKLNPNIKKKKCKQKFFYCQKPEFQTQFCHYDLGHLPIF